MSDHLIRLVVSMSLYHVAIDWVEEKHTAVVPALLLLKASLTSTSALTDCLNVFKNPSAITLALQIEEEMTTSVTIDHTLFLLNSLIV
ncbi:hypothetical protein L2E82_21162 [Cichorium intybus]|uniref:Uncharacterized protein n=1 Tax=Cichorium intybus TaxID=13427 RepID=A0ACB9DWA0_CICIN|nr:hypothetical protein L2E82_21162 [Cichorium intybus]